MTLGPARHRAFVIGAGPAGAVAALCFARAGHSATIVERANPVRRRPAETLPPRAADLLRRLGLWDRFAAGGHRPSHRTDVAWGESDLRARYRVFDRYGTGWHVDRARFDAMLVAAAVDEGARLMAHTRLVDIARRRDRWQVALSGHGDRLIESCDWLVDATGRGAIVARMLGQRWTDSDNAIALLARLSPAACVDDALLVESGELGWWYSAALRDRDLLAVHITDADAAHGPVGERWNGSLAASHHTRERVRGCTLISLRVCRASTGSLSLAAGDRWVAVGDAVLAHDPLSGQGLLYAIASGIRGAAALQQDATNGYADRALLYRHTYFRRRTDIYRTERRWPLSQFWQRRQVSPLGSVLALPRKTTVSYQ